MEPLEYWVRMVSMVEASRCRLQVSVAGTFSPLTWHIISTFSPTVTMLFRVISFNFANDSATQQISINQNNQWSRVREETLVINHHIIRGVYSFVFYVGVSPVQQRMDGWMVSGACTNKIQD